MQNGETCCISLEEGSNCPLIVESKTAAATLLNRKVRGFNHAAEMVKSSGESPIQMHAMSVHLVNGNVEPSLRQICDNVSTEDSQESPKLSTCADSNQSSFTFEECSASSSENREIISNGDIGDACDGFVGGHKPLTKVKLEKAPCNQRQESRTETPTRSNTCENCGQELSAKASKTEEIDKSPSDSSIFTCNMSMTNLCRICHCESNAESGPLIAPCRCKGTLEFVHQSCLQQWIKSSDYKHCELCGFHFAMNSKLKPITKWEKLSMSTSERRKIICSVMFHVIAITCVIWSLYVLIERTADELKMGKLQWPFWTKLVVVAIGFTGGLVFMYVQCKVYVQLWRRLKAFNRIIYVQDQPAIPPAETTTATTTDNSGRQSTSADCDVENGGMVVVDVCQESVNSLTAV